MNPEIVLGPPGTGKTTALLAAVSEELARGVPPDRIGYVSFTRRAAEEAISRACDQFSLERKQFPYFRTLHSLCFRRLGLQRSEVLEDKRIREFAQYAGIRLTGRWSEDGTFTGQSDGDRALFLENLSRLRNVPLLDQYSELAADDNLPWTTVQRVQMCLAEFKREQQLLDYTDMLSEFVRLGQDVGLEVLFVDEAQDLSALQWQVVSLLATTARRVVIAGDDDQAIYRWAGADADHLITMEGQVRVLDQSYRVPPSVQDVAARVIGIVERRRTKEWKARPGEGVVSYAGRFADADCGQGDVMILARNSYVLDDIVAPLLREQGIIYERNGHPSIRPSILDAATDWENLRGGQEIFVEEARVIYQFMTSGIGVARGHKELPKIDPGERVSMDLLRKQGGLLTDAPWFEALDRLPQGEVAYMRTARARGEKLRERPRVRLSTIHGSKGGEADHVVLLKDMAARTYREMHAHPDDEARVWYVAATRAREQLTLVESRTDQECPWL